MTTDRPSSPSSHTRTATLVFPSPPKPTFIKKAVIALIDKDPLQGRSICGSPRRERPRGGWAPRCVAAAWLLLHGKVKPPPPCRCLTLLPIVIESITPRQHNKRPLWPPTHVAARRPPPGGRWALGCPSTPPCGKRTRAQRVADCSPCCCCCCLRLKEGPAWGVTALPPRAAGGARARLPGAPAVAAWLRPDGVKKKEALLLLEHTSTGQPPTTPPLLAPGRGDSAPRWGVAAAWCGAVTAQATVATTGASLEFV